MDYDRLSIGKEQPMEIFLNVKNIDSFSMEHSRIIRYTEVERLESIKLLDQSMFCIPMRHQQGVLEFQQLVQCDLRCVFLQNLQRQQRKWTIGK